MDAQRWSAAFDAAAGAALFGIYNLARLWLSNQPPTRRDYIKAAINVAAAIAAGALLAIYLTPVALSLLPIDGLRDPHAVAFVIGALGWECIPVLIAAAKGRIRLFGRGGRDAYDPYAGSYQVPPAPTVCEEDADRDPARDYDGGAR